jgi:transcriptional regulator with XRE-family HTH domain
MSGEPPAARSGGDTTPPAPDSFRARTAPSGVRLSSVIHPSASGHRACVWGAIARCSQLHLSIAAGVSARHVSLVETGKPRPSAAMVLRLAEQLDVPLRDRNRLLLAAGFPPRYAERPLDREALSAARDAVRRVLSAHEPYPAVVLDRQWNLVMATRAFAPFLADAAPELLRPPVNIVRLALDPRGFAPRWPIWPGCARYSAPASRVSWPPPPTPISPRSTTTC